MGFINSQIIGFPPDSPLSCFLESDTAGRPVSLICVYGSTAFHRKKVKVLSQAVKKNRMVDFLSQPVKKIQPFRLKKVSQSSRPQARRRSKVRSTPFPPKSENSVRFLAPLP
ncbi:MAG: hypothetical protein IJT94_05170, partial [Oscillibacter sp.]|nr:hypothetical protein [Oscillibacter sp.]